jgi:hypothetical protein
MGKLNRISNRIIRKLNPCYDPSEVIKDEQEELSVKDWVAKYRDLVHIKSDIVWLLCHKLFMTEKDMRLFAVWCAREALKLIDNPNPRIIEICNVAERYANGEVTSEELKDAYTIIQDIYYSNSHPNHAVKTVYGCVLSMVLDECCCAAIDASVSIAYSRIMNIIPPNQEIKISGEIWDTVYNEVWDEIIDKLLTYFN